jgi:hypothetical protein
VCQHRPSHVQSASIALWVTPSDQGLTPTVSVPSSPQQLFIRGPGDCAPPAATSADTLVVTEPQSAADAEAAARTRQAVQGWVCSACGLQSGAAVVLPLDVVFPGNADTVRLLHETV